MTPLEIAERSERSRWRVLLAIIGFGVLATPAGGGHPIAWWVAYSTFPVAAGTLAWAGGGIVTMAVSLAFVAVPYYDIVGINRACQAVSASMRRRSP